MCAGTAQTVVWLTRLPSPSQDHSSQVSSGSSHQAGSPSTVQPCRRVPPRASVASVMRPKASRTKITRTPSGAVMETGRPTDFVPVSVADSRHMTVFVSFVLGAEAVGFGDSGQIATRVVLVATRTTAALGDGHGQAVLIERRSGPDTVGGYEPDAVAVVVALETGDVAQRVGVLQKQVAGVEHEVCGVPQGVGLGGNQQTGVDVEAPPEHRWSRCSG